MVRIALDVTGGDHAPGCLLDGAMLALQDPQVQIMLLGDERLIIDYLYQQSNLPGDRICVVHCPDYIDTAEAPVKAIRSKKNAPIVRGMQLLKENQADAFVSAGNTGALLAAGIFVLGRIPGISRPALTGLYPSDPKPTVLLDIGANADCKAHQLHEFAVMGHMYAKEVLGIGSPVLGLVNIGTEADKGSELYKEAHRLLCEDTRLCFKGNIEAREIPYGKVDVAICDGFTGNIILKTTEGVAMSLFDRLKRSLSQSWLTKAAAWTLKDSFLEVKSTLDSEEHGGAPLLGVDGVVIKAHGSSTTKAIRNAIFAAKKFYQAQAVEKIRQYAASKASKSM